MWQVDNGLLIPRITEVEALAEIVKADVCWLMTGKDGV
jgi:hypothetical protein